MNKFNKIAMLGLISAFSSSAFAADGAQEPEQVFNPDIERADVTVPAIDTESFELGGYVGSMRVISDSDNSMVYGVRATYHINEDIFIEGTYAFLDLSVETRSGEVVHESSSVDSSYYNGSLGYNLIPGELFVTDSLVMPVYLYGIVGVGNTVIDDTANFTFSFGGGMRVLLTDALATRLEFRDHIFDSDATDKTNNTELSFGLSWFF